MSLETLNILRWISRGLLGVGAFASTFFFIDYFRAANLTSVYTRLLLTLNGAIAVVLWVSLAQHFVHLSLWAYIVVLSAFFVVDVALIAQIVLLRATRKRFAAMKEDEE